MIASSKKKIILYEMLMEQINLYIMGVGHFSVRHCVMETFWVVFTFCIRHLCPAPSQNSGLNFPSQIHVGFTTWWPVGQNCQWQLERYCSPRNEQGKTTDPCAHFSVQNYPFYEKQNSLCIGCILLRVHFLFSNNRTLWLNYTCTSPAYFNQFQLKWFQSYANCNN